MIGFILYLLIGGVVGLVMRWMYEHHDEAHEKAQFYFNGITNYEGGWRHPIPGRAIALTIFWPLLLFIFPLKEFYHRVTHPILQRLTRERWVD